MRCVSYNIQYGKGADGRYDLARIAGEVADADIIALQEVDRFWARSGMVDAPAILGDHLPDHHWVYGPNLDLDASFRDDDGRLVRRRKQFGTMILSRTPIISTRNFPLPKWGDRQLHSIQQGLLEAVVETDLGPVRIYSVHLSHLGPFTRLPQVERIKEILATAPEEGGAWCGGHPEPGSGWIEEDEPPMPEAAILMGDMNFLYRGPEYESLVGGWSPHFGRLTNRRGLADAWVEAGNDEAAGTTYSGAEARIDHCFVTIDLAHRVTEAWVDEAATGSDHYPLWVSIGG